MATFEEFVQIELPLRPAVLSNPGEETVLVRRGIGPRIYVPVDIIEGEVLGKLNGNIQSVSNGAVVSQTITVPAGTTKVLGTYSYSITTAKKVVLDITDGVNYEAFESIILRTGISTTDYSIYGIVGFLDEYQFVITNNVNDYSIQITNTSINDMDVNYKEIT